MNHWSAEDIHQASETALSAAARAESERLLGSNPKSAEQSSGSVIDGRYLDVFIICPLSITNYDLASAVTRQIEASVVEALGVTRNAIFLVSKQSTNDLSASLLEASRVLDIEMKSSAFPFNRCFFVDDLNEAGQRLEMEDIVTLVAEFISLSIASDLSVLLRQNPAPFIGDPPHQSAYASFSWNRMTANTDKFIGSVSEYLARDVARFYLADTGGPSAHEGAARDSVRWFRENREKPINQIRIACGGLLEDADYKESEKSFDEFSKSVLTSVRFNFKAYRDLAEECLDMGLVELELLNEKMRKKKGAISDLLIKIMLEKTISKSTTKVSEPEIKRPWLLVVTLLLAGIASIGFWLERSNQQTAQSQNSGQIFLLGGALLILGAVVASFRKKIIQAPPITDEERHSFEELLRKERKAYDIEDKRLDIHLALFARLDRACMNLDLLKADLTRKREKEERDKFDFELLDDAAAKRFYENNYDNEKKRALFADLAAPSSNADSLHHAVFSYPRVRLFDYLLSFCRRQASFLKDYTLDQMCDISKSFTRSRLFLSPPFWNPMVTDAEERIVLVSASAKARELLADFLPSTLGTTRIKYSRDAGPGHAIVFVQIGYGVRVDELFLSTDSTLPQSGKSDQSPRGSAGDQPRSRGAQ